MTPQERLQFQQMQKDLAALKSVQDVNFIENIKRRIEPNINTAVANRVAQINLNDLADVDTSGVTNGQVIKYNSGIWENANDNTA